MIPRATKVRQTGKHANRGVIRGSVTGPGGERDPRSRLRAGGAIGRADGAGDGRGRAAQRFMYQITATIPPMTRAPTSKRATSVAVDVGLLFGVRCSWLI